ncbi:hypothetical protein NPIL_50471 [Nephila pilipes]|uniref:Uncharacterized protein n=1 Tax=Nephila pilipes TaxID=299642 RepID=A0A8X6PV39_NEPPI|nr:hypothetical protein NPIL_50471 [Nephila pilipes]
MMSPGVPAAYHNHYTTHALWSMFGKPLGRNDAYAPTPVQIKFSTISNYFSTDATVFTDSRIHCNLFPLSFRVTVSLEVRCLLLYSCFSQTSFSTSPFYRYRQSSLLTRHFIQRNSTYPALFNLRSIMMLT